MAGKPGRSGGARSGAGRPPKSKTLINWQKDFKDPKEFLTMVMNAADVDLKLRIDASKALMPFEHNRKSDQGKKAAREDVASQLSFDSFFAPAQAPAKYQ